MTCAVAEGNRTPIYHSKPAGKNSLVKMTLKPFHFCPPAFARCAGEPPIFRKKKVNALIPALPPAP